MIKYITFLIFTLGVIIPESSLYAQCFDGDPNSNGPEWDYSITIEENYNAARRWEETDLNLSANCLGDMVEPNVGWGGMNEESTALYIHNSERVARGKLPLYDVESNLDNVAQNHSEWQIANGVFSHGGDPNLGSNSSYKLCSDCDTNLDGSSPFDRMNHDPPLQSQWQWESENIGVRVTSGSSLADFVPERIYAFIYRDAGSGWGHRHAVLHDFNNDWGSDNTEGFIGVGIQEGNGFDMCQFGCDDNWNLAKIITIDYYDPAGSASGFSFKGLPIELLAFTAQKLNSNVLLTWSTAIELNNDYFLVEKSTDGIEFEEMVKINGAIDSKSQNNYKYTDYNPLFGVNYYRLKQVDLDGNYCYSNVEKIEFKIECAASISPNPFDDFIIVHSSFKYNSTIQIFGLKGEPVFNSTIPVGNKTTKFYLPDIDSGIYFVKIKNNNFKKVFKLVKL